MTFECGLDKDLNGSGDRNSGCVTSSIPENPGFKKRRLSNGIVVPVFPRGEVSDQNTRPFQSYRGRRGYDDCPQFMSDLPDLPSSVNIAREFLSCPICSDPCIETTSINCGHKFCRDCIERWRTQKPICPICSTLITSQNRLFSDDLLIESLLDSLPVEVRERFQRAQQKRLESILEERKSRNMMKRVRKKLDNSLAYLRCKNVASMQDTLSSASQQFQSKLHWLTSKVNVGMVVGMAMMGLLILLLNNIGAFTNFMHYLWLAVRNYDGKTPEDWLHVEEVVPPAVGGTSVKSGFEELVDKINLFRLIF